MTPLPQQRLSGATLLLGGLLAALGYVLMPTTSTDPSITPASWLLFTGNVLLLVSLPWFSVVQGRAAGALGWWGTLVVCLGLGFSQLPGSVLGLADPRHLDDDSAFHASAAGTAEFAGLIALAIGIVLLAVATFRARVYPRWAAWCVLATVVLSLAFQFLPDVATAVRYPAEIFVLVGALGLAVMAVPASETAQQDRPQVPVA